MNNKFVNKSIFISIFAVLAILGTTAISPATAQATIVPSQTIVITNAIPNSDIGTTTVYVTGVYNAGTSTSVDTRFDWGLTPSFGNSTPFVNYTSATGTFNATITGLMPGQQYYVRAFASGNNSGPGFGSPISFTTKAITAPFVITTTSSNVTSTAATLAGVFNGNNASSTEVKFVYGTSSSNLNQDTGYVTNTNPSGTFSANISGLTPSTTYFFRAVAKNSAGTTNASQTLSFTTLAQTATCSINSFSASPSTINQGNSTTLSWTSTNCTTFSINNGVGTVTGNSYTINSLNSTTTYTLTASGSTQQSGTDTANETVTVNTTSNPQCVINYFYASPSNITIGNSTTIYYSTSNCNNVNISNYGNVGNGSGSFNTNTLYGNTSYTINASGQYNTPSSQTITVNVQTNNNNNYCVINYFYASPSTVTSGASTVLYYSTSNCTNVYISNINNGYSLNNSGSISTQAIYNTTTYTISGYNYYGGTQSQSTIVSVVSGPIPCNGLWMPAYNGCQPCGGYCPNPNPDPNPEVIIIDNTPGDTVTTTSDVAELSITSQFADIYPGDIYSYTISYKNISSGSLDNAVLNIDMPMQVNIIGRSTGIITGSGKSVSVNLGTLSPKESGTLTIDVRAEENLKNKETLLAKVTLSGTKRSSGANSVTSAYTLTHVKGGKNDSIFAGLVLFGDEGFLPTSFGGWIALFALLALVIFVGRKMYTDKKTRALHGHTINPYDVAGHH